MDTPAANSPGSPVDEDGTLAGIDLESSPGIMDFQARERRTDLLKFACEAAAVSRRYRAVHKTLFGFTLDRVLTAFQPTRMPDYAGLEIELDAVASESRRLEYELEHSGLDNLPQRAKIPIAFRDALPQYTRAVSAAVQKLHHICVSLRQERLGQAGFTDYSDSLFAQDRAAYDASVQEIQRWGARLTELTEKL